LRNTRKIFIAAAVFVFALTAAGFFAGFHILVEHAAREESAVAEKEFLAAAAFLTAAVVALTVVLSAEATRVLRMIEEQRRRIGELADDAMAAAERNSSFISGVSREIRGPLGAIVGLSESILEAEGAKTRSAGAAKKIYESGIAALGFVSDAHDLSQIEAGRFALAAEPYDTAEMIADTIRHNAARAAGRSIAFAASADEDIPCGMIGDHVRLKRVINNIMSGVFRHIERGRAELRFSCERDGDGAWLSARITASGFGVNEDEARYAYADDSAAARFKTRVNETERVKNSITKKLVGMMSGSLGVEGGGGQGVTFTARVRQGCGRGEPIGPETAAALRNLRAGKRSPSAPERVPRPNAYALIVDDIEKNLRDVGGLLASYGMRVDRVDSGQAAVDLVWEEMVHYDAIFMDLLMPGMDGVEATRIIREDIDTEYAKTVPIIVMTADDAEGDDEILFRKGFQDILAKPVEAGRLDEIVGRWITPPREALLNSH
jgi:CheY-like chemotaxis protein/signal transduction histidine kinase